MPTPKNQDAFGPVGFDPRSVVQIIFCDAFLRCSMTSDGTEVVIQDPIFADLFKCDHNIMNQAFDEQTKSVAAEELKKILLLANKMTTVDSERRRILFELTKAPVTKLLELSSQSTQKSNAIRENIASLARALLDLRNLGAGQIETLAQDDFIDCPHCLTTLTRTSTGIDNHEGHEAWYVYCRPCSVEYTLAFEQLCHEDAGFGVDSPS